MCGIAGFKRFGKALITPSHVNIMLTGIEKRGNHATGISIQNKSGKIFTMKDDEPGWKFIATKKFEEFILEHLNEDTDTVILHARAATKGSPRNMDNNHPLTLGKVSVVHNGMIWNDDELFKKTSLPRNGEVDSDIIRAILDDADLTKKGVEALNMMRGSAAIAAISEGQPGKLLLARSGNPIVTACTKDMFVWASEKRFIHAAMRPVIDRFGMLFQVNIPEVAFNTMQDHSAWLIGEKGLEWHSKFEMCQHYTAPRYDMQGTYKRNRDKWYTEMLPEVMVCPNKKCAKPVTIPESYRQDPAWKLQCPTCKSPLASMEEEVAAS